MFDINTIDDVLYDVLCEFINEYDEGDYDKIIEILESYRAKVISKLYDELLEKE